MKTSSNKENCGRKELNFIHSKVPFHKSKKLLLVGNRISQALLEGVWGAGLTFQDYGLSGAMQIK